ncbi:HAD family acid phosphatase [Treponema phagedenis]|uniref:HAD family acid phosphatase n=1 Tax=Treponema phagedenis TaxID=162 RepID=UPI001CA3DBD9|nr:HAD family acid phosphatase [Treponema phagedenis]
MGDEHSIPKQSAKDLIDMHLKRGDKIFFITGRTKHSAAKNYTSNKLSKHSSVFLIFLKKYLGIYRRHSGKRV